MYIALIHQELADGYTKYMKQAETIQTSVSAFLSMVLVGKSWLDEDVASTVGLVVACMTLVLGVVKSWVSTGESLRSSGTTNPAPPATTRRPAVPPLHGPAAPRPHRPLPPPPRRLASPPPYHHTATPSTLHSVTAPPPHHTTPNRPHPPAKYDELKTKHTVAAKGFRKIEDDILTLLAILTDQQDHEQQEREEEEMMQKEMENGLTEEMSPWGTGMGMGMGRGDGARSPMKRKPSGLKAASLVLKQGGRRSSSGGGIGAPSTTIDDAEFDVESAMHHRGEGLLEGLREGEGDVDGDCQYDFGFYDSNGFDSNFGFGGAPGTTVDDEEGGLGVDAWKQGLPTVGPDGTPVVVMRMRRMYREAVELRLVHSLHESSFIKAHVAGELGAPYHRHYPTLYTALPSRRSHCSSAPAPRRPTALPPHRPTTTLVSFVHLVLSSFTSGMLFLADDIPYAGNISTGSSFALTALNTAIQVSEFSQRHLHTPSPHHPIARPPISAPLHHSTTPPLHHSTFPPTHYPSIPPSHYPANPPTRQPPTC